MPADRDCENLPIQQNPLLPLQKSETGSDRFLYCLAVILLAFVVIVMVVPLPGRSLFWSSLSNASHSLLFACLTLGTQHLTHRGGRRSSWRSVLLVSAGVMSFGIATEALQAFTTRSASLGDLGMNSIGVIVGTLLFSARSNEFHSSRLYRSALTTVASATLAGCFAPSTIHALVLLNKPSLPAIAHFDHSFADWYVDTNPNTSARVSDAPDVWASNHSKVLQVTFGTGEYPGFRLVEPPEDWTGYERLSFKAFLEGSDDLGVTLRIHDKHHANHFHDRFNRRLQLHPGLNNIEVALDDIKQLGDSYSRHREMNLREIKSLMIFAHNNTAPATLFVDGFQLR